MQEVGSPTREQQRLWMGMARVVSHLSRRAGQAVHEAQGINLSEMTLMGQVRALGGAARMVDLATRLQVTKAAVTKIVDSLEGAGYIARNPDESDRRVVLVVLTDEGERVLARSGRVFESIMQEGLWDHLSESETEDVNGVFDRLQGRLGLHDGPVMPPRGGAND